MNIIKALKLLNKGYSIRRNSWKYEMPDRLYLRLVFGDAITLFVKEEDEKHYPSKYEHEELDMYR